MSKHFYLAVTLIVAAFALFETGLNLLLRRENTKLANLAAVECLKPTSLPDLDEYRVYYFQPGTPIKRGTQIL